MFWIVNGIKAFLSFYFWKSEHFSGDRSAKKFEGSWAGTLNCFTNYIQHRSFIVVSMSQLVSLFLNIFFWCSFVESQALTQKITLEMQLVYFLPISTPTGFKILLLDCFSIKDCWRLDTSIRSVHGCML
jgi:hypothetical protein